MENDSVGSVFQVFKRIGNGAFIHVQSCETLEEAALIANGLNDTWPGEYAVRDAEENDVARTQKPLILLRA